MKIDTTWLKDKFELSRGGKDANLKPMEGLRGFAVFLVFLVHYVSLATPWIAENPITMAIASSLHRIGNAGVDLFFVLSGYLIYGSLIGRTQKYLNYIYRRIERIYPTFTVVFLLYIILSFIFPAERKIPSDPTEAVLYLIKNFLLLPGLLPLEPMITVAWSLSYEMFYYLIIPIGIQALQLRKRSSLFRVALLALITITIVLYCAAHGGHIRLIMFISGIFVYEAMSAGDACPKPSSLAGILALIIGLLGMLLPISGSIGSAAKACILFASFGLLCLACFKTPSGYLARFFCFAPIRWLGNLSYSYYLIHGLSLKAFFLILPALLPGAALEPWLFWAALPLAFSITIPPAVILYIAVERRYSLSPSFALPTSVKGVASNA